MTPLFSLVIPATRRRGLAQQPDGAHRSISVELLPSGVLDADVDATDEDGEGERSRLGPLGIVLLLLLLVGSVVSVMGRTPLVPAATDLAGTQGATAEAAAEASSS